MHHQWMRVVVGALALGIVMVGCTSVYLITQPRVLHPCAWVQDGDPKINSMAALILAMQANKWSITQGSAEHGFVRAQACRGSFCASVDAFIDPGGTIEIYDSPNQSLDRNAMRVLEGWLEKLSRRYEMYRCELPPDHIDLVENLYMPTESIPGKPVTAD